MHQKAKALAVFVNVVPYLFPPQHSSFQSTSPLCGVKDTQAIDTQEGRASAQRDLTKSEDWANNSAVKFNKDKYIALHLDLDNPMYHHSLGSSWHGIWWRIC